MAGFQQNNTFPKRIINFKKEEELQIISLYHTSISISIPAFPIKAA